MSIMSLYNKFVKFQSNPEKVTGQVLHKLYVYTRKERKK